jgi:hypothetical protein
MRIAGDLADDPIGPSNLGKEQGWTQFATAQVGEGKGKQYYFSGCKCAHAASSSGPSQFSANEASENSSMS